MSRVASWGLNRLVDGVGAWVVQSAPPPLAPHLGPCALIHSWACYIRQSFAHHGVLLRATPRGASSSPWAVQTRARWAQTSQSPCRSSCRRRTTWLRTAAPRYLQWAGKNVGQCISSDSLGSAFLGSLLGGPSPPHCRAQNVFQPGRFGLLGLRGVCRTAAPLRPATRPRRSSERRAGLWPPTTNGPDSGPKCPRIGKQRGGQTTGGALGLDKHGVRAPPPLVPCTRHPWSRRPKNWNLDGVVFDPSGAPSAPR